MTDIGVIPEDWEVKSIGEIAKTTSGGTPSREDDSLYIGKNRWFTTSELNDGYIYDSIEHISDEAIKITTARIVPANSILMAMYGATIGKLAIITKESSTNQACCAIMVNSDIVMKYVFYNLLFLRQNIIELGVGAGQPNISQSIVRSIHISIPSKKEQQAIADALTKVDNLITSLTKVIEKKKLIKKGTMQKLLSGEMRLDGFDGEWKQIELCKESSFERGWGLSKEKISDNGSYNCILYGEIFTKYNYVAKTGFSKTNIKEGTPSLYGDIVLPGSTTTCGIDLVKAVAILKNNILLGGDVNIIRFDLKQYDPIFMAYYFSEINKDRIEELTKGITIIHLHISDLKNVIIDIPPTKAEQTAIAKVLTTMDNEIEALEKERDKYKCIKQGMMQQLLTGKIRLICQ